MKRLEAAVDMKRREVAAVAANGQRRAAAVDIVAVVVADHAAVAVDTRTWRRGAVAGITVVAADAPVVAATAIGKPARMIAA